MIRTSCLLLLLAAAPLFAQDASGSVTSVPIAQQRTDLASALLEQGSIDSRTSGAFAVVPREQFLPAYLRSLAYQDTALPLGAGLSLASPSDIGRAISGLALRQTDKVLVYGSATGYAAALVSRLASAVEDVELDRAQRTANQRLFTSLGYANIAVAGPALPSGPAASGAYDAILINGAVVSVPATMTRLLAASGRLVAPVRDASGLQLMVELSIGTGGTIALRSLGRAFFVPIETSGGS
jgi:protein-L-isoaspartate(D-aspartate) O-methyltransferase